MKQNKNNKVLAITLMVLLLVSLVSNVALFLTKNKVKKETIVLNEKVLNNSDLVEKLKVENDELQKELDAVPCWNKACKAIINSNSDIIKSTTIIYKFKGQFATLLVMQFTTEDYYGSINDINNIVEKGVEDIMNAPHKEFGEKAIWVKEVIKDSYGNIVAQKEKGQKPEWFKE